MEPFVSYEEYLQMKGVADGSEVSFGTIRRMHALPEIFPAWCSNGAYWGAATEGGGLFAIRNLDWNRDMALHRYAAVKLIEMPGREIYANIGYAGFTGVLTGLNEKGISIGEIGAASVDETMKGVPMPFLIKRMVQNSASLEDALEILKSSNRTRGYHYVIADATQKKALVAETTWHHLAVFHDEDPAEKAVLYSFTLENAVFRGDPALDPEIRDLQIAAKGNPKRPGLEMPAGGSYEIRYLKQGKLVKESYGRINAERAIEIAKQVAPGSNIQSVVFAFPKFFVANAKDNLKAADTEYVELNFEELAYSASS